MQYSCTGIDTPGGLPLDRSRMPLNKKTAISSLLCADDIKGPTDVRIGPVSVADVGGTFDRICSSVQQKAAGEWLYVLMS